MKKTKIILLIAFMMIFCCSCNGFTEKEVVDNGSLIDAVSKLSQHHTKNVDNLSDTASVIIILLYPNITEAVNDYFGQPTQWSLAGSQVNYITKLNANYLYRISITVPTFHGPHNPPYGLETMTFLIKAGDVALEEYVHKDVQS